MAHVLHAINWWEQEQDYYCGPAVAKMFLDFHGIARSQDQLWCDVVVNTGGAAPAGGPPCGHPFPEQACERCLNSKGNLVPVCWDSSPEGLSATINALAPANSKLQTLYATTQGQGTDLLLATLNGNPSVPPVATLYDKNHWVLVNGYTTDTPTPGFPNEPVGNHNLNGVYITDPQQTDPAERVAMIAAVDWLAQFGIIGCGTRVDTYPVLVRQQSAAPPPPSAPQGLRINPAWLIITFSSFILLMIWMFLRADDD